MLLRLASFKTVTCCSMLAVLLLFSSALE
jgi:hypothetical protein